MQRKCGLRERKKKIFEVPSKHGLQRSLGGYLPSLDSCPLT